LSAQVDDLPRTLASAQDSAQDSAASLQDLTNRAEAVAKRLELLVASMHDLPDPEAEQPEKIAEPIFQRRAAGARRG
jgi:uncharacterized membrane protein YccC